jgi:hypothetical protein
MQPYRKVALQKGNRFPQPLCYQPRPRELCLPTQSLTTPARRVTALARRVCFSPERFHMTKTQEIGLPLNPLRWEANVGHSILLLCTMLGLEGACSAPESGSHDIVEMIGPDQFRYATTASVLHPLNSSQGEHTRMVRLDHHLKA